MSTPSARLRFDASPRWLLVCKRGWRPLVVLVILALAAVALPHPPAALDPDGWRALIVFVVAVVFWVTGAIPLIVTALGIFAGLSLLDVAPPGTVAAWFANDTVFFLLGAFLLAGCLASAHVVDHIALRLLEIGGSTPTRLRILVAVVAFFGAWFLPEHAVVALLFPVLLRIRDCLERPRGSSTWIVGLFLALAWGASIGGTVTYLGGARAPLAAALLSGAGYEDQVPGFLGYLRFSLPVAVPMLIGLLIVVQWRFPVDIADVRPALHALRARRRLLGRFGPRQWAVTAGLMVAIALWVTLGRTALAPVALLVPAVLMGLGLVRWDAVERSVSWSTLLLYGGALALAAGLRDGGAAAWLASGTASWLHGPALLVIGALVLVTLVLTEAISNAAVVGLLVPMVIPLALDAGLDPVHLAFTIAIASGLPFLMPMGSPGMATCLASGEYSVGRQMRNGLPLTILAAVVVTAVAWYLW